MKWRMVLPALLVLLMPLPLVWLLFVTISRPGTSASMTLPPGKTLVPMLSREERLSLTTYAHDCRTDADCAPQLRCVYDVPTRRHHCTDSLCLQDGDCPQGFTCIPWSAENDKDLLGVCSMLGTRKEGELCMQMPERLKDGCEKGLFCQGFCGRLCRVGDRSGCPEGYYCRKPPVQPRVSATEERGTVAA